MGRRRNPSRAALRPKGRTSARVTVVVIGGGIAGVSCAYHLQKAGRQVVLLEKGELTSGSTHHAAGLVTQFNPSPTMMQFRRYSVQLYEELGVFERVGSLRVASSHDSLLELRRGVSRAHAIGLDAELVGPEEARALLPAMTDRELYGAVWMPGDGAVDPHIASYALASAARARDRHRRPRRARAHRRDRARPDRVRARRERRGHVGAASRGHGRSVHVLRPGRPPAHRPARSRRARASPRRAVLPR